MSHINKIFYMLIGMAVIFILTEIYNHSDKWFKEDTKTVVNRIQLFQQCVKNIPVNHSSEQCYRLVKDAR